MNKIIEDLIDSLGKRTVDVAKLKKIKSPWVVNTLGDWKTGEISIVRKNFLHGRRSWGWDEPSQKVILYTTPPRNSGLAIMWDTAYYVAWTLVHEYNTKEGIK